jgi:hypothetical protein
VTKLQNILAPLAAFTRQFSADPMKPKATGVLKFVSTTTSSTNNGKNLTAFEDGDSTVSACEIAVDQYTRPFNISNADLQNGLRLEDLVDINVAKFGDIIMPVVLAPVTAANFPAQPVVSAAGAFGFEDLQTIWGKLKKSRVKNLVLDGEYYARLINTPTLYQKTGTGAPTGWGAFGWDGIYLNTNWTGADTNVVGFAANPQALGVVAGLPVTSPVSDLSLSRAEFKVPGLDLSVVLHSWFSLASRTGWASLDVMLGAALLDGTAGVLIKSA